ncbi:MAG: hypothetical protein GY754_16525 [bacterium]|nr:hypothetical protein [bacterium]
MKFYFFKNDRECNFVKKLLNSYIPKYLLKPVDIDGKKVQLYVILNWLFTERKRESLKDWLDDSGIKYVNSLDELPDGAGIYAPVYEVQHIKGNELKNIPIVEQICPWIKQVTKQVVEANSDTHQLVFLNDKGNAAYNACHSYFPDDIIFIDENNYKEEIGNNYNNKPLQLIVYTTFRKKDAERVISFINTSFNHPDNILDGYKKSLCRWSGQGLFEEITDAIENKNLTEIWLICNSDENRSTKSIINEIRENNCKVVIIRSEKEFPEEIEKNANIGVLIAPYPISRKMKKSVDSLG